jgi:hypothetical protein
VPAVAAQGAALLVSGDSSAVYRHLASGECSSAELGFCGE